MAQAIKIKGSSLHTPPDSRAVMRSCIVISLMFHLCALFGMQEVVPINLFPKPLRTYRVELIRPPVDQIDEEAGSADLTKLKPEDEEAAERLEDTISLDTSDKRYISYARVIKDKLNRNWKYPQKAYLNLIEGNVFVRFTLDRKGTLLDVTVLRTSGFGILDDETLRAIRAAAPFPPFPGSVSVKRLNIKANFAYRLTPRKQ